MDQLEQKMLDWLQVLCPQPETINHWETHQCWSAPKAARKLMGEYCIPSTVEVDQFGSVIGQFRAPQFGEPVVLLDAHIDQIGLVVTGYEENGFLKAAAYGGMDRRVMIAQDVLLFSQKEGRWLSGVVASIPPHLTKSEDRDSVPEITDLLIDTGLTKAEAEDKFPLGSFAILAAPFHQLGETRVNGSGLDDRAGLATLLGVLELLKDAPLHCGITLLFSNREEVNSAGAQTAGYRIHPDLVLAVDVSFADGPGIPKDKCGKLGKGPMIGVSPTLTPEVSQRLIELAQQQQIPYQIEVMGGSTGTNADSLSLVRGGRRSGLVSVPQRNMHTTAEIVDLKDMANTAKLLAEYLKEVR